MDSSFTEWVVNSNASHLAIIIRIGDFFLHSRKIAVVKIVEAVPSVSLPRRHIDKISQPSSPQKVSSYVLPVPIKLFVRQRPDPVACSYHSCNGSAGISLIDLFNCWSLIYCGSCEIRHCCVKNS